MPETPDKKPPQDLLEWLGIKDAPNWAVGQWFGRGFAASLFLLFILYAAAFGIAGKVVFGGGEVTLGAGGLIAALLGAPFLIWGTILKHQTLRYQKEGHMTDRIAKAVEMLGAEKTVDRIGRPVTIWTGKIKKYTIFQDDGTVPSIPHRAQIYSRRAVTKFLDEIDDVATGSEFEVWEWPDQRTVIEWQNEKLKVDDCERIAAVGDWQAFSETKPNLEVRIGAILALERIAQDSTTHDKGRDHVRVMEILCAYIRENSWYRAAKDHGLGDWEPLKDNPTDDERKAHLAKRKVRFGDYAFQGEVHQWAKTLTPPREDIAQALTIIGRRTHAQLLVEAAWPNPPSATTTWVFDTPCPALPDEPSETAMTKADVDAYRKQVAAWNEVIDGYTGYPLDLRGANLQGADMTKGRFQTARFEKTRMEGANLTQARMEGANLTQARMEGAVLMGARMEASTSLNLATLTGAALREVDYSTVRISAEQVKASFGDASVILPEALRPAPDHWLTWEPQYWPDDATEITFLSEYRRWLNTPAGEVFIPAPPPE